MFGKNSLANKKRKRIKYDATSGSISGFLLSSSEKVEMINLSEDSLDCSESAVNQTKVKGRLSTEFDDSFDLFTSKKASKKPDEISSIQKTTCTYSSFPGENSTDSIPCKLNHSPSKKRSEISPSKTIKKSSPSRSSNSKSPVGKSKRVNTVKKCDYFDSPSTLRIPCPFCFKFEEDIYTHISTNCIRPSHISETTTAQLLEVHTEYWNRRRTLGIPDFTFNEDEVFKPGGSQGANKVKDLKENICESSAETKIPILKWNSKSKKSKYLLLRQSKTERESKITQKLAILLMGSESENKNSEPPEHIIFQTSEKSVASSLLSALLAKELTFWEKSSLGPDKAHDDIYYIKALAPFIAPKTKTDLPDTSRVDTKIEEDDAEVAAIFASVDGSFREKLPAPNTPSGLTADRKSETRDSCFTELGSSELLSTDRKPTDSFITLQSPFASNWENIFSNSDLSDSTVLFRDGHFFGHSLVFYTHSLKIFRCLSSSSNGESTKLLDWKDVSSVVGKAYIKYIYTGNVSHFKAMRMNDLYSVKLLCEKYDEVNLLSFINSLLKLKSSQDTDKSFKGVNRNRTSPDIFDDIDSSDSNCVNNATFTLGVNRDSLNSSVASKRKLHTSSESLDANESCKKVKTDPSDIGEDISSSTNFDLVKMNGDEGDNEDVISISSAGAMSKVTVNDDIISVSSTDTMSPGRYSKLVCRPLSQCSTLPPLSEALCSPPIFPDSPVDNTITQNTHCNVNYEEPDESFENTQRTPDNQRIDNTFDNNYYMDLQWEDFNSELVVPESDKNQTDSNTVQPKTSLDKYFDDSLPTILLNNTGGVGKTPHSANKSIQGSPMFKSTPSRPIVTSNNLTTPSPQIHVSDQVTPMLNYSNLISPELKGELRKYGLKPDMDRKKAKILLKYIYESVHPVVSEPCVQADLPKSVPSEPDEPAGVKPIIPDKPVDYQPIFPEQDVQKPVVPEPVFPEKAVQGTDVKKQDNSQALNYAKGTDGSSKPVLPGETSFTPIFDGANLLILSDHESDEIVFEAVFNGTPSREAGDNIPAEIDRVSNTRSHTSLDEDYTQARAILSPEIANDVEATGNELEFDLESSEDESIQSGYLKGDVLRTRVSNFIKNDPILFDSILKYVPIWLTKLHQALKENGIRCKKADLMYTLDELCIIFRTERSTRLRRAQSKK